MTDLRGVVLNEFKETNHLNLVIGQEEERLRLDTTIPSWPKQVLQQYSKGRELPFIQIDKGKVSFLIYFKQTELDIFFFELEHTSNLNEVNCRQGTLPFGVEDIKAFYWNKEKEPITYPRDLAFYKEGSSIEHSYIVLEEKKHTFVFFMEDSDISLSLNLGMHSPFWDEAYE